jgi:hypothetical protein
MGWGRWFLLGDIGQQLDLADQQAEIESLKWELQRQRPAATPSIEKRLERLQRENDELKLYLTGVVRILVAKKIATIDEIKALVTAVDREDGALDNTYKGPIVPEP